MAYLKTLTDAKWAPHDRTHGRRPHTESVTQGSKEHVRPEMQAYPALGIESNDGLGTESELEALFHIWPTTRRAMPFDVERPPGIAR